MRREQTGGFTLIEAIVSLAIIGVLATFLLMASVSARRNTAARIAADQFAGFLRETAALAANGVRAAGCAAADLRTCAQYRVAMTAGAAGYTRQAIGGGAMVTRALPGGTQFGAISVNPAQVDFRYTPPTLAATAAEIPVRHAAGAEFRNVCLRANGTLEVRGDAC